MCIKHAFERDRASVSVCVHSCQDDLEVLTEVRVMYLCNMYTYYTVKAGSVNS